MGVPRLELGTSALSGLRSNQLSYTPNLIFVNRFCPLYRVGTTTATTKYVRIGLQSPRDYLSTIPHPWVNGLLPLLVENHGPGAVCHIVGHEPRKLELQVVVAHRFLPDIRTLDLLGSRLAWHTFFWGKRLAVFPPRADL